MFRPVSFITLAMACGSGLYLYQVKHQAQVLDRQIERTVKQAEALRAQARELDAAWTLLGNPDRIQQLADQFLTVKPVQPSQFVSLTELDSKLPSPRPSNAAPAAPPGEETPVATEVTDPAQGAALAAGSPPAGPEGFAARADPTTAPPAELPATPLRTPPAEPVKPGAVVTEPAKPAAVASEPTKSTTMAARPVERKLNAPPHPAREVAQTPPRVIPARPSVQPVVAELDRPIPPPHRSQTSPQGVSGSLLGMAHDGAVSVPAPQPMSLNPTR
jgi:hypothetical protein